MTVGDWIALSLCFSLVTTAFFLDCFVATLLAMTSEKTLFICLALCSSNATLFVIVRQFVSEVILLVVIKFIQKAVGASSIEKVDDI